jgi:hypothetical protein
VRSQLENGAVKGDAASVMRRTAKNRYSICRPTIKIDANVGSEFPNETLSFDSDETPDRAEKATLMCVSYPKGTIL